MDASANNTLFAAGTQISICLIGTCQLTMISSGGSGGNLSLFELGVGLYCNSTLDPTVIGRNTHVRHLPPFLTMRLHDAWISGVKFLDLKRDGETLNIRYVYTNTSL